MDVRVSGGFDVELVDESLLDFTCPLCNKLLRQPIQTVRGERACRTCYIEQANNSKLCPIDSLPIDVDTDIFIDKFLERKIAEFLCFCSNKDNGCPWKGHVRDGDHHIDSCDYGKVECVHCHNKIVKINKERHDQEVCLAREVKCQYCSAKIVAGLLQEHFNFCPNGPRRCPYNCGEKFQSCKMAEHLVECAVVLKGETCPFSIVGCDYNKSNSGDKSMIDHLKRDSYRHTIYILDNFHKVRDENKWLKEELKKRDLTIRDKIAIIETELSKVRGFRDKYIDFQAQFKETITKYQSYISKVDSTYKQLGNSPINDLTSVKTELSLIYQQYEEIEQLVTSDNLSFNSKTNEYGRNVQGDLKKFSKRIESIESHNAILNSNVSDLELQLNLLENTSYDGIQIWKISDVLYRINQCKAGKITALHSPPCFTEKWGYKFCTRLYLNGDGVGKGTHLSLFVVIKKSDFDCLLEWPLRSRVTFELLHPSDKELNIKESFLPDSSNISTSFNQPKREMNVAAGCPKFLIKEDLINKSFIADDCIFIKTTISLSRN